MARLVHLGAGTVALLAVLQLWPERVSAEPAPAGFAVEREAGSEGCPDAAVVLRAMTRLFPERALGGSGGQALGELQAVVRIRPTPNGHEAVVRVTAPRQGERVILDEDSDCRGLSDALAVALVLLSAPPPPPKDAPAASSSESGRTARPDPAVVTGDRTQTAASVKVSTQGEASTARPSRVEERERSARLGLAAKGEGVAGVGLLGRPALGAALGLEGFTPSGFGLSLAGARLWAQTAHGEGGSIQLSLWALFGGPCMRQWLGERTGLDGCLWLGGGRQHAEVQGLATARPGSFPFWIVAPRVALHRELTSGLRGFWGLALPVQLEPQSFSVQSGEDGRRVEVIAAPRIGLMAELGLSFGELRL